MSNLFFTKFIKLSFVLALVMLSTKIYGHCQVPCGIYDDAVRIVQIEEDITTIRKAMNMINDLAGKSDAQSLNQISRWVTTKESHAQNAQETILNYFLAQGEIAGNDRYETGYAEFDPVNNIAASTSLSFARQQPYKIAITSSDFLVLFALFGWFLVRKITGGG